MTDHPLLWPIVKAFEDAVRNPVSVDYDGCVHITITGPHNIKFVIFMDCGYPDYLDHIKDEEGNIVDFFHEEWEATGVTPLMTNNIVCYYAKDILKLAQQHPKWDYLIEVEKE